MSALPLPDGLRPPVDVDALRGVREGPIGRRIVLVAGACAATVVMIVALAVALAPPRPPGSVLAGTTWEWTGATTGATTGAAAGPLVVADPSRYTIEFMSDFTFRAVADCTTVSGTYWRVLAGRTGLPSTGLALRPDPYSLAPCSPDSLSGAFLQGLWSAERYAIADAKLEMTLRSGEGTMSFEARVPRAASPGSA